MASSGPPGPVPAGRVEGDDRRRRRGGVVGTVACEPVLGRIASAFAVFSLAETATWLAMLVAAFERGGTREAGALAVAALSFAVLVAPFASFAGDRFRADRVLVVGFVVQASTMAAAAASLGVGATPVAYASMIAAAGAITLTRPVVASLLPAVTHRPADLVAANVVMSAASDVGLFAGPLIAGAVLAIGSPAWVFGCFAALVLAAAAVVRPIRLPRRRHEVPAMNLTNLVAELGAGVRELARNRTLRALLLVVFAGGVSIGAIDVVVVTLADRTLDGSVNVGILAAAVGLGALGGSLASAAFIARPALSSFVIVGALAITLPLVLLTQTADVLVVLLGLAVVGCGQSVIVVVGNVALQRWTAPDVVTRVFGVQESLAMLALATGTAAFTVTVDRWSVAAGLVVVALVVAGFIAVGLAEIVRIGADVPPPAADLVDRLRVDPIFAPLDVRAIERLARSSSRARFATGEVVTAQGDVGDRYFLVVEGQLTVTVDGVTTNTLGAGDSFGEIALLHDVPRTATVTTLTTVDLVGVDRTAFVEAVTGHPTSESVARAVARRHHRDEPDGVRPARPADTA
jgi:predicted MFS family arabinose efflux permease